MSDIIKAFSNIRAIIMTNRHQFIQIENVNIYEHPSHEALIDSYGEVTLGDLHSNVIKALHFLFIHKIIKFKDGIDADSTFVNFANKYEQEYQTLFKYIKKQISYDEFQGAPESHRLGKFYKDISTNAISKRRLRGNNIGGYKNWEQTIQEFYEFLHKIEILDSQSLIRLLGDELADRGLNDILILILYEFFHNNSMNVTTLLSNHGVEFLQFYYTSKDMDNFARISQDGIIPECKPSLFGLKHILEMGLVTKEQFKIYVERYYLPTLKILDYNLTDDGIQLFTHAPSSFDIIRRLANKFNVAYLDATPQDLANTINAINTTFQQYLNDNRFHELFPRNNTQSHVISSDDSKETESIEDDCLRAIIWDRWTAEKDELNQRPHIHPTHLYSIEYIHGHDAYISKLLHVINLDAELGKGPLLGQEYYKNELEEKQELDTKRQAFLFKAFNSTSNRGQSEELCPLFEEIDDREISEQPVLNPIHSINSIHSPLSPFRFLASPKLPVTKIRSPQLIIKNP